MVNKIRVFENQEFGKVRILELNNEPWFVGKDVAEISGEILGGLQIVYVKTMEDVLAHALTEQKATQKAGQNTTQKAVRKTVQKRKTDGN